MDDILPNWAAPEILAGTQRTQQYPLQAADVYSFALVLYEVISKRVPFEEYFDDVALRKQVRRSVLSDGVECMVYYVVMYRLYRESGRLLTATWGRGGLALPPALPLPPGPLPPPTPGTRGSSS